MRIELAIALKLRDNAQNFKVFITSGSHTLTSLVK